MTVRLEGTIKRFIGLSTDQKPVVGYQIDGTSLASNDLPAGSSFLEQDTGRIYRWTGTEWSVSVAQTEELDVLQDILLELASIREAIMEGLA